MSTTATKPLRIGEVAELTGTTTRTIRYYEELGLLGEHSREHGKHRTYTEAEVERIRELVMLKELLGLTLEQLAEVVETVLARAEIRQEYRVTEDLARRRELLLAARPLIARQLELTQTRIRDLRTLERELIAKLELIGRRLTELEEA